MEECLELWKGWKVSAEAILDIVVSEIGFCLKHLTKTLVALCTRYSFIVQGGNMNGSDAPPACMAHKIT